MTRPAPSPKKVTPRFRPLGVACFEGYWESDLTDRQSVLPVLDLLARQEWITFVHRHVGTKEQLVSDLKRWTQKKYDRFPVAYLAFHGSPGSIHVGDQKISLQELGQHLNNRCQGRLFYVAGCSSLDEGARGELVSNLAQFRDSTKARLVAGTPQMLIGWRVPPSSFCCSAGSRGIRGPASTPRSSAFVVIIRSS